MTSGNGKAAPGGHPDAARGIQLDPENSRSSHEGQAASPRPNGENGAASFAFSLFADVKAKSPPRREATTFDEFRLRLEMPETKHTKEALPLLVAATFGDRLTVKGCYRHQGNVESITGAIGDYDAGAVSIGEARDCLEAAGVEAFLYTTPSHRPDHPRWRAVAPASQAHKPGSYPLLVARLNGALGGILTPESFTESQSFYLGRAESAPEYVWLESVGDPIDTVAVEPVWKKPNGVTVAGGDAMPSSSEEELRAAVVGHTNYHDALRDLTAKWAKQGYDEAAIRAKAQALHDEGAKTVSPERAPRFEEAFGEELDRSIEGALRKFAPETESASEAFATAPELPPAPEVTRPLPVRGGDRARLARQCAQLLGASRRVFVRGGVLVRPETAAEAARAGLLVAQARDHDRAPDALVIVPAVREWLQTTLTESPGFLRLERKTQTWLPTDCPPGIAAAVATLGDWRNVAPLLGIATTPFLRADGTLCVVDGYDAASMMLLCQRGARVLVQESPSLEDARRAVATLLAPFAEFPFATTTRADPVEVVTVEESHRTSFLAMVLTLATRHLYECAPAFVVSSAGPGTGKTLLAVSAALLVTGVDVGTRTMPADADEMRKSLTGAAVVGDAVMILDNITDGAKLASSALEQFLTTGTHRDRVLGTTNSTAVPNVTTVIITGNNITVRGALRRRVLPVRIVADTENPELRSFRIADLKAHIRARRTELVGAVLTLLRAYVVAALPEHGKPLLGSFETWDRIVRGALIWAGLPDPLETQAEAGAADEDSNAAAALLELLEEFQTSKQHGGTPFALAEARSWLLNNGEAHTILGDVGGIDKLGYWFREHVDRVHGGRVLRRRGAGRHLRWRVASTKDAR